ncbi:hypothetical protein GCM10023226_03830 [Nocardioides nanhaiensis]|uniref:Pentapeptide repeat-containing protein n=1 Tax=Nocardioides nanhaiensis TaxID=1476871 RepID=A0ABP8VS62_9ACTN
MPLGELGVGDAEELVADADLDGRSFDGVTTPTLDLGGAAVLGCAFIGVAAREADWGSTRLHEVTFDRLDVPVMRAPRGDWREVRVEGSRLGSVEAYETSWRSVHFVGCKLGYLNLRGAELLDVAFTDCTIEEIDVGRATARRVAFAGSRLARLTAQGGSFEHVDLRGCELAEVDGVDCLRGVTISPEQLDLLAPLLARERGIKVEGEAGD